MKRTYLFLTLALAALALYVGCSNYTSKEQPSGGPEEVKKPADPKDDEHAHQAGTRGGIIVSIGQHNYHAEAVFEKDGTVRLFTLGKEEARIQEVEKQTLKASVWPEGDNSNALTFELKPEPQTGDAEGKTSQFVGRLPQELIGKKVVASSSITIDGGRFRFEFRNTGGSQHAAMPQGVKAGSEKERQLFLQPGGIYTQADIEANGNRVPSVKFKDVESWPHEDAMQVGDKICPVTKNKADARCSWIVNDKEYEFCCPPCLHKFIGWAKKEPEKVKDPSEYVNK